MKKTTGILISGFALLLSTQSYGSVIYETDFENTLSSNWSSNTQISYSTEFTSFLGRNSNDTSTFSLSGLGSGNHNISLSFDLYLIDSWDGNSPSTWGGPDTFGISGDYNNSWILPTQSDSLPYSNLLTGYLGFSEWEDTVYQNITLDFTVNGDSLSLNFYGQNLQTVNDESWGLDNIKISNNGSNVTVVEPAGLALFGLGLIGLGFAKRKRT